MLVFTLQRQRNSSNGPDRRDKWQQPVTQPRPEHKPSDLCDKLLPPQSAVAPEAPVNAAVVAGEARDVPAKLIFEGRRPGHKLEAEAVVDHGETARRER